MNWCLDKSYICPECGQAVAPVVLQVFGQQRYIQGTCKCQIERHAQAEAERKELVRKARIERLFDLAELGPRFQECTFESWVPRPGTELAFRTSKRYAESFQAQRKDGQGLLLFGRPGNGKSHLAAAVVNYLVPLGHAAVFRSALALLKRLQAANRPGSKIDESVLLEGLREADLVVLDDIGAEKWTEWAEMMLYHIVDERYRWKKPLIVTTNCSLEAVEEHIGARTFDRLLEMCLLVENQASSYRKERAFKRIKKGAV